MNEYLVFFSSFFFWGGGGGFGGGRGVYVFRLIVFAQRLLENLSLPLLKCNLRNTELLHY